MILSVARRFLFSKKARELLTNPEFDKIYPDFLQHKPPTTFLKDQKEVPFMESLFKYNQTTNLTFEEAAHRNYTNFVEGLVSPRGPLKDMTDDQKKQINIIIDAQMRRLEETGLSREEILTNGKSRGIPLTQDSFFQYLKNNYDARYVYLSPNEEYTPEKVIDLALKQDIGSDNFNALSTTPYENRMKLKPQKGQSDTFVNTKNPLENVNQLIKDDVIHHPSVKSRFQKRSERVRRVNNYDIHWRNTEFLIQFLNRSAKIRSRFQTGLSNTQQKKIARTIDVARHMLLLPVSAALQPYHKKSLTNLENDIQDHARRRINLKTGQIYVESELQRKERSLDKAILQEDHEIDVGISRPNTYGKEVVKAQIQAQKLKQEQLDLKFTEAELAEAKQVEFGDGVGFTAVRDEELLKQEIIQESQKSDFQEEFDSISKVIAQVPAPYFAEALIGEFTYKKEELEALAKRRFEKKMSKEESLKVINQFRKRVGLSEM